MTTNNAIANQTNDRLEKIFKVSGQIARELSSGVSVLEFASRQNGSEAFSTGLATFQGGASLPFHTHPCGESITVLDGRAAVVVENRVYHLAPLDSIHVPAGVAHGMRNLETKGLLKAHTAFASDQVRRESLTMEFPLSIPPIDQPPAGAPEALVRFEQAPRYELSPGALFSDLFARRLGALGICGGYGRFAPGSSLPCHTHLYDESISIIEGSATCLAAGRRYTLGGCDTAVVPHGVPHRFINESRDFMAMIWVYAGDEPERVIVDNIRCSYLLAGMCAEPRPSLPATGYGA